MFGSFRSVVAKTGRRLQSESTLGLLRVEQLKRRSLISVEGPESADLLQSLLTNDVEQLEEKDALFTLFLNNKGRVIHEAIVYKSKDTYFVECDISGVQALQMHMKMYKLRRKVRIESVEKEIKVWVVMDPKVDPLIQSPSSNRQELPVDLGEDVIAVPDPRLPPLGIRVLAPRSFDLLAILRSSGVNILKSHSSYYRTIRYKLGVGEGLEEIPYSKYSAMEANADYLNAVCPKKVAYVGHKSHTEDVKRRLMPLVLKNEPTEGLPVDTPIEDVKGRRLTPLGQLRGLQGDVGLGLISLAAQDATVKICSLLGRTVRPYWWPSLVPRQQEHERTTVVS